MAEGDVTLKIPRPLYNRLAKVIEGTGLPLGDRVLRLRAARPRGGARAVAAEGDLSPEELQAVQGRLRALGYLGE